MVGGVLAITSEHFKAVNGFSNRFFGWGGEDDDFYLRLVSAKLAPARLPAHLGRYVAMWHPKQAPPADLPQRLQQVGPISIVGPRASSASAGWSRRPQPAAPDVIKPVNHEFI